jgi:hypothetical protein
LIVGIGNDLGIAVFVDVGQRGKRRSQIDPHGFVFPSQLHRANLFLEFFVVGLFRRIVRESSRSLSHHVSQPASPILDLGLGVALVLLQDRVSFANRGAEVGQVIVKLRLTEELVKVCGLGIGFEPRLQYFIHSKGPYSRFSPTG